MSVKNIGRYDKSGTSVNMTAIIDIVFLLIIFFLVVCQFIEAENFDVDVPDDCEFAQNQHPDQQPFTTVSVIRNAGGPAIFAVGSEKITASDYNGVVEKLAGMINTRLAFLPVEQKVVTLRIDRDTPFAKAQYALAAVALSNATEVQFATLKDKRPETY